MNVIRVSNSISSISLCFVISIWVFFNCCLGIYGSEVIIVLRFRLLSNPINVKFFVRYGWLVLYYNPLIWINYNQFGSGMWCLSSIGCLYWNWQWERVSTQSILEGFWYNWYHQVTTWKRVPWNSFLCWSSCLSCQRKCCSGENPLPVCGLSHTHNTHAYTQHKQTHTHSLGSIANCLLFVLDSRLVAHFTLCTLAGKMVFFLTQKLQHTSFRVPKMIFLESLLRFHPEDLMKGRQFLY